MHRRLVDERQRTESLSRSLDALSPLRVLGRGYSLTRRLETDQVIRAVNGITLKGRSVRVDYDRGGPALATWPPQRGAVACGQREPPTRMTR